MVKSMNNELIRLYVYAYAYIQAKKFILYRHIIRGSKRKTDEGREWESIEGTRGSNCSLNVECFNTAYQARSFD